MMVVKGECGHMKKEMIENIAGVILLYLLLIGGVIFINDRLGELNESNTILSLEE